MNLREWLSAHLDDLGATILIAVLVAALVGFIKRSTGAAVFISCSAATMLVLIFYPWVSNLGYRWDQVVPALGVAAGFCAVSLFKIAMKFSDKLGEKDGELAEELLNRAKSLIPGRDNKP